MTSKLKTDVLETVSGSGTIALTNQLSGMTDASVPAGSVIQVVTHNITSTVATTSTTYADTGVAVTFTPKSSSSTIQFEVIGNTLVIQGRSSLWIKVYDPATSTVIMERVCKRVDFQSNRNQYLYMRSSTYQYVELASWGTSARTYRLALKEGDAQGQQVQFDTNPIYLKVTEIKG